MYYISCELKILGKDFYKFLANFGPKSEPIRLDSCHFDNYLIEEEFVLHWFYVILYSKINGIDYFPQMFVCSLHQHTSFHEYLCLLFSRHRGLKAN